MLNYAHAVLLNAFFSEVVLLLPLSSQSGSYIFGTFTCVEMGGYGGADCNVTVWWQAMARGLV
jgi:hypothetical protein